MSQPMTLLELRDAIAKAVADAIGHGMREKCERHADEVLKVVAPQLLATADDATLRQQAARVNEGMATRAIEARNTHLEQHPGDAVGGMRAALEAALSAQPAERQGECEAACPEDRFEQYVAAAIARSPEPLRELGEYLTRVLDEDQFPTADRLLLQLATAHPAAPVGVPDVNGVRFVAWMIDNREGCCVTEEGLHGWLAEFLREEAAAPSPTQGVE